MPRLTLVFGVLLIILGVIGYAGDPKTNSKAADSDLQSVAEPSASDVGSPEPKRSITALIPAFAGGLLLVFGGIGLNESWRMHAMHGAALVGSLSFLAAAGRGASGLYKLISSDAEVNTRSLFFVCSMAVLCGIYVVTCVNSFVQARRRQREDSAQIT